MILGLTGGIATGKTTVAKHMIGLGAMVVSADALVHKALHSSGKAYTAVANTFSHLEHLLDTNNEIDRKVLGRHVFHNEEAKHDLEAIVHPIVQDMFDEFVEKNHDPNGILIYDCPLLFEHDLEFTIKDMAYIICTTCPDDIQLDRLMKRNSLSRREAQRRINSQLRNEQKADASDFVIDTSLPWEDRATLIYNTCMQMIPVRQQVIEILSRCPHDHR